jgi:hypothetical protein
MSVDTLIACSGHAATQARHWIQAACDSEMTFCPGAIGVAWIAPVGHDRTQSSHPVHRLKSMTGNPNDTCAPNGSGSVSVPVLRLLLMMPNIGSTLTCPIGRCLSTTD